VRVPGPVAGRPFLSLRGDRVRLEVTGGKPLRSDLFSPGRWGPYLDELAACGYNLLELHGPAGADRDSGDLLSHCVIADRGAGARPPAERQRNLAGLRRLVALAAPRGIGVVLTSATPAGGTAADLTRAVRALAAAVPELSGIGVQTGSDRRAAVAAVDGIRGAAGFRGALHLEARLSRAAVEELACRLPGRLVLRVPLDEGELTRPYLPLGDPPDANDSRDTIDDALTGVFLPPGLLRELSRPADASGAYEEHLRLPRPYALLWELGGPPGAAGLPWLDAIFARHAARFCAAGGALGFLVASPSGPGTAGAPADRRGDDAVTRGPAYPCWWWHALWGAAGCSPERAEAAIRNRFGQRFGVDAGDFIFNSVALLSRMSVAINAAMGQSAALPTQEPAVPAGATAAAGPLPAVAGPAGAAALYVMSGTLTLPVATETAAGASAGSGEVAPDSALAAPAGIAASYLMTGVLDPASATMAESLSAARSEGAEPAAAEAAAPPSPPGEPIRTAIHPALVTMQYLSTGELMLPDPASTVAAALEAAEGDAVEHDPRAYASIGAWAEDLLAGRPDGRPGPIERAHELAWFSMRIRGDLDTITLLRPRDAAEWERLRVALLSGAHLADFYARTLSAAYYRRLYRLTGDEMALTITDSHEGGAREAGDAFWSVAGGGRRPVLARSGLPAAATPEPCAATGTAAREAATDRHFAKSVSLITTTTGSQGGPGTTSDPRPDSVTQPSTEPAPVLRAALERSPGALRQRTAEPEETLAIHHIPAQRGTPTRALRIDATIVHGDQPTQVLLRYWLPGATDALELPMTVNFGTARFYAATIPGEGLTEGVLRYRIEARGGDQACDWPGADAEATWSVPVSSDTDGPRLQARHRMASTGRVRVEATATDPSGVARVLLHWRPLDGHSRWQSVTMSLENGVYAAELPLPRAGLAYSVEAHDRWGNARCFPEPRRETPYVLVTGPDRPSPEAHAASGSSSPSSASRSGSG
jgi:hypothetical protein